MIDIFGDSKWIKMLNRWQNVTILKLNGKDCYLLDSK